MLEILALAKEDGHAFVRDGETVYILRPPYVLEDMVSASIDSVEQAVSKHGFSASTETFSNWKEVILFLNQQVAASNPLPSETSLELGMDIIKMAPIEVLKRFLDRPDISQNVLVAILASDSIKSDPDPKLYDRAMKMLEPLS